MRSVSLVNATTAKTRRGVSQAASVSDEDAKSPAKLSEAIRQLMNRLNKLESVAEQEGVEFEVTVGVAGAVTELFHNFKSSVRWWVTKWHQTSGVTYPITSHGLVEDSTSDSQTLRLRSYVAGRAVVRVVQSQSYVDAGVTVANIPITPSASAWTVFNSVDSVAITDDPVVGVNISRAGNVNADQLTGYSVPIAAGNFTAIAKVSLGLSLAAGARVNGGSLFISDGTKYVEIGLATSGGAQFFQVNRWTNATTFGATPAATAIDAGWKQRINNGEPTYLHIVNDGTNLNYYVSLTGRINQATLILSEAVAVYLGTITKVGICMRGNNAGLTAVPTKVWLGSLTNQ